ncbi:MAG TPA: TIGR02678 family protein [Pseudonocardiaceae bacterium]|nr:TIGR02678 family protein [Pseudonocardiaceae bacterium]
MRAAAEVGSLELAEYQKTVRLVLRHPLVTASYPDQAALATIRRWATQLRQDFSEVLGYTLVLAGDTARLRRTQDTLDGSRPALSRAKRPFDRRRYAYLTLTLAALGRSGAQIALSELADAVAADAGRIDGLGMDTTRKPDRDAFVDAVSWLEERGGLRMADGSALEWANDPEHAEALYDIDREVVAAIWQPSRVLQHLRSVTELLDQGSARGLAQGREAQRRTAAQRARRLVVEQPAVYYADVEESLRGQLRSPALAEDLERLTGLGLERRAEGVALVDIGRRLSDTVFPSGGTVAQAALLLCARIAGYLGTGRGRFERLPSATAAERLDAAARRLDAALPERPRVAELLDVEPPPERADERDGETEDPPETAYPFLSDSWLRTALHKLVADFGAGMAEKQAGDPDRLLADALALLAAMGLLARVDGGVLVLPLVARYRSVTAHVKARPAPA